MGRTSFFSLLSLCVVILMSGGGRIFSAEPQNAKTKTAMEETPAEKLHKALDHVFDVEIADLPLDAAINQLRAQTGVNLVIDAAAVPASPVNGQPGSHANLHLRGQFHGVPLRTALTSLLRDHNLTHVVVADTLLITTTTKASERQLGQMVSVNAEGTPLRDVLRKLVRETGANIVLDPHASKEGQTALTVRLNDVPLTTAVDVLADEAGLRAVRLHNVLYVTSEARAEKLRKTKTTEEPTASGWRVWPDGKGSFRMTPPASPSGGGGITGGGGIAGLGGAGLGALGMGGIGGLGGGGFNQLGGFGFQGMRMAAPVPLTPPLPTTKPAAPQKPTKETIPAKPKKLTVQPRIPDFWEDFFYDAEPLPKMLAARGTDVVDRRRAVGASQRERTRPGATKTAESDSQYRGIRGRSRYPLRRA
jgi:hypothetical protein